MAGTGSADGTPFAYSQTGDQLFVPPWTRFRSARFCSSARLLFSVWSACHAHGTSPPRVALPGGVGQERGTHARDDSDHPSHSFAGRRTADMAVFHGLGLLSRRRHRLHSDHRAGAGPGRSHLAAVSILVARHCEHQRSNPKAFNDWIASSLARLSRTTSQQKMTLSG